MNGFLPCSTRQCICQNSLLVHQWPARRYELQMMLSQTSVKFLLFIVELCASCMIVLLHFFCRVVGLSKDSRASSSPRITSQSGTTINNSQCSWRSVCHRTSISHGFSYACIRVPVYTSVLDEDCHFSLLASSMISDNALCFAMLWHAMFTIDKNVMLVMYGVFHCFSPASSQTVFQQRTGRRG